MKQVFFGLFIFSLFLFSYPAILLANAPLAAPVNPEPKSGVPFISFPLQLDWEDVPGAQSYRYELIGYEEDGEPKEFLAAQSQSGALSPNVTRFLEPQHPISWYQDECKNLKNKDEDKDGKLDECTDGELRTFVKQQQKRLWHVKSCEDAGGTICGPWSAVWNFAYLPGPPPIDSFSPALEETEVKLPVTLHWGKIVGAKSYLLRLPVLPAILSLLTDEEKESAGLQPYIPNELPNTYTDEECLFTRNRDYAWGVASCLDADGAFCGPFQESSFYTDLDQPPLSAPHLTAPLFDPAQPAPLVSMTSLLSWNGPFCAYLYNVKITRESDGKKIEFLTQEVQSENVRMDGQGEKEISELKKFWQDPKNLNQVFSWQITPCWSNPFGIGADCTLATPSETWKFRTSGQAPILKSPKDGDTVKIPVPLKWEPVEEAGSYRYEISRDDATKPDGSFQHALKLETDVASHAQARLEYKKDVMEPNKDYWWHVKTCADTEGGVCGEDWSQVRSFSTYPLLAAASPEPADNTEFSLPDTLRWQPDNGASYYQYQVRYTSLKYGVDEYGKDILEDRPACTNKTMGDTVIPKPGGVSPITSQPSFYLSEYCRGEYEWLVLSCADKDCNVKAAAPATLWKFTAAKQTSEENAGLVPCGKTIDHTNTPFDETEPCELKHAGFLLQNLLDFILWKVSLFVLLVLAVMTGATSYFSLGGPNALARMKTVFKSFFVGFLILMFAWMFVNIVLMLFGFRFEFFGKWWELSF